MDKDINKIIELRKIKRQLVTDYIDLGAILNIAPQIVSYTTLNKSKMQYLVKVKDRNTWASDSPLYEVQTCLMKELIKHYEEIDTSHMLAYIPGKNYIKKLKELAGEYDFLIQCDIRKYFDNISAEKINNTLILLGWSEEGARMITRLSTVNYKYANYKEERTEENKRKFSFLQQGSVVAPVISNLVGYFYIDNPVKEKIGEILNNIPTINKWEYYRYCDNLYIFIKGSMPLDTYNRVKEAVKNKLWENKFKTHNWSIVSKRSPKRAMRVLGVVVNTTTKIENNQFDRFRAALFNVAAKNKEEKIGEIKRFLKRNEVDTNPIDVLDIKEYLWEKFFEVAKGKIAYIKQINLKQWQQLKNLLELIKIQKEEGVEINIEEVKKYKYNEKEFRRFIKRLKAS